MYKGTWVRVEVVGFANRCLQLLRWEREWSDLVAFFQVYFVSALLEYFTQPLLVFLPEFPKPLVP